MTENLGNKRPPPLAPDIPGAVAPGYPGKWTIIGGNSKVISMKSFLVSGIRDAMGTG